jgi:hypothetical protein
MPTTRSDDSEWSRISDEGSRISDEGSRISDEDLLSDLASWSGTSSWTSTETDIEASWTSTETNIEAAVKAFASEPPQDSLGTFGAAELNVLASDDATLKVASFARSFTAHQISVTGVDALGLDRQLQALMTGGQTLAHQLPIGATIKLHDVFGQTLHMNSTAMVCLQRETATWVHALQRELEFVVVDGGSGTVALYNANANCFVGIGGCDGLGGPAKPTDAGWLSARFEVVPTGLLTEVGVALVAIYSPHHKAYLGAVDRLKDSDKWTPPSVQLITRAWSCSAAQRSRRRAHPTVLFQCEVCG